MLTHIHGAKCIGIDAVKVTVEIDIDRGIGIHLVGLADVAVKESLLRTTTALEALVGYLYVTGQGERMNQLLALALPDAAFDFGD